MIEERTNSITESVIAAVRVLAVAVAKRGGWLP